VEKEVARFFGEQGMHSGYFAGKLDTLRKAEWPPSYAPQLTRENNYNTLSNRRPVLESLH
jgi:hypothetical protein